MLPLQEPPPCRNVSELVAGMKLGHAKILPPQEAPMAEMFRNWLLARAWGIPKCYLCRRHPLHKCFEIGCWHEAGACPDFTFAGGTPCRNVSELVACMKLGIPKCYLCRRPPLQKCFELGWWHEAGAYPDFTSAGGTPCRHDLGKLPLPEKARAPHPQTLQMPKTKNLALRNVTVGF